MLQLQNLLSIVIIFAAIPFYCTDQSKYKSNLEMDFGYANNLPVQQSKKDKTNIFTMSVEYSEDKKNVKSILKQQYDDDVDKGKEKCQCHKCFFVFPQEKMFWMDHEDLCYECLYRFVPTAKLANMFFTINLPFQFEEADVDIAEILQNEIPFKDCSIIPQLLGNFLQFIISSLIYTDNFYGNIQGEWTKIVTGHLHYKVWVVKSQNNSITPLLQPIVFGYICITSCVFVCHMYGPRIKRREFKFSLFPCMNKDTYSKHLDTGHPGFQLFFGIIVVFLYSANYMDGVNWLLYISMSWSIFSLWFENNIGLFYFGRYFSVFYEIPLYMRLNRHKKFDVGILKTVHLEDKNSFGKNFIVVSNQLMIFFNVVSSIILSDIVWNTMKEKVFRIKNCNYNTCCSLIYCVEITVTIVMWSFVLFVLKVFHNGDKQRPLLMTFNTLLRFIFAGVYAAGKITVDHRLLANFISFYFVFIFWQLKVIG